MRPHSETSFRKLCIIVAITLLMAVLVIFHVKGVNGPWYWFWPWRQTNTLKTYGGALLAAVPMAVALAIHFKFGVRAVRCLPLLMLTSYLLMLLNVVAPTSPMDFGLLRDDVQSLHSMSYYNDAAALQNFTTGEWLSQYSEVMPKLNMHSQSKPAGPVLFFSAIIARFGYTPNTPIIAGLIIAAIAMASIPLMYWLTRLLIEREEAAFISAAMLALCPSFVLPLPLFDPCYVMITCGLVGLWVLALRRNSIRASIGFGAVLAATLIVTFNVLVIGAFLAAFAIIGTELPPRRALARAAKHAAIAIGTCFILLTILWAMTGYNALAVFQTAWQLQHRLLALNPGTRPYPWTVIFDLWDFALGCGWILFVLAIFGLVRSARGDGWSNSTTKVLFACAAMPLLVALTHLLPGETARVWGFLLPFVLLPAAYELAHWTVTGRIVALACLWLALATISQNIWIVMPWA